MKKINLLIVVSLLGTFLLPSCRLVDFTIISSKNISIDVKKDAQRVSGKGFTLKDAIDHAIEKAGSGYDALIDGVVYSGAFRYKITGTPIKTSEIK